MNLKLCGEDEMETIKIRTHIGSDGLLKFELPVGIRDVDAEIVVVYSVQPASGGDDCETFINETYGILADDPIERPAELPFYVRDEIK
jgi:hypothetical protein